MVIMANKASDHQPAPVFYFDVVGDYEKTDKSPKGREDRVAYSTTNYLKTPIGSNPQKYNSKVEDGMTVNRDTNLNGASKKGQSKIQGKGKKRNGGKWNEKESSREVMGSGVVYENTLKIGGVTLMLDNNVSSKTNSYGAKAGTKSQRNTIVNNKNNKKNTNRIQKQPTSRSFSQNNYVNEYPIGVIEFDYENEKNTNRMQKQSTSHYTSESKYINEYPIGGIEIEYDSLELGTPSKAVDTEEEMSLQDYIDNILSSDAEGENEDQETKERRLRRFINRMSLTYDMDALNYDEEDEVNGYFDDTSDYDDDDDDDDDHDDDDDGYYLGMSGYSVSVSDDDDDEIYAQIEQVLGEKLLNPTGKLKARDLVESLNNKKQSERLGKKKNQQSAGKNQKQQRNQSERQTKIQDKGNKKSKEFVDLGRRGAKANKKDKSKSKIKKMGMQDLKLVHKKIKQFARNKRVDESWLWPMEKRDRRLVHALASEYNIKTSSRGQSNDRFTILMRTEFTTEQPRNIRKIERLLQMVDRREEHRLEDELSRWKPYVKKVKVGQEVGEGAQSIGGSNKGHQLLSKLGWTPGNSLGATGDGIVDPIKVVIRQPRRGLGL